MSSGMAALFVFALVVLTILSYQQGPLACTQDTYLCGDGSSVGRDPNHGCQFHACSGAPTDYASVVNMLRTRSVAVQLEGAIAQSWSPVPGQQMRVGRNNEELMVFVFASPLAAQNFAQTVSPNGGKIGEQQVTWTDAPHFHQSGKLVAIYIGADTDVTGALTGIFGEQFAGPIVTATIYCRPEQRGSSACIEIYQPVCGWSDPEKIQCIRYPCAQTYSNSCHACADETVLYYTTGACP